MVYLKVGDEYGDGCLTHLKTFLGMLDTELSAINQEIKASVDPDTEGLCDLGEYFIGYGFVAIQRYLTSTYPQTKLLKNNIYKIGHKIHDDLHLIEAINAGANYWKHEEEWYSNPREEAENSKKNKGNNMLRTLSPIEKATPYANYTLANLLHEILQSVSPESELSFSPILPFIEEWRNSLHELATKID